MNVLSDILCDTSLMMSQNYSGPLLSHDKIIQSHNSMVSSKQEPLHLLDTLSDISTSLNTMNNSSPIDLFNPSNHMHLSTSIESPSFHDGNQVSAFTSNSFQEIVPSWLTHDFMKVSENLPASEILSNVTDIYPSDRERENLEMLELGFHSELSSQDSALNNTHLSNAQKLLTEDSIQRFSSTDSLLLSSFENIGNPQLQLQENKLSYTQSQMQSIHKSPQSMMNSVLPCDSDLLHLPLSSSLADECLSSSSPSIISRNQSQPHTVDVVCDKLPQINLNHLDTLLGNENALPTIQLLNHSFPNVRMSEDITCVTQSNEVCDTTSRNIMQCDADTFQNNPITSISHSQDISVQVSENLSHDRFYEDCLSCVRVDLNCPIEVSQCFKCRFCSFVSLHKCFVAEHINTEHNKSMEVVAPLTSSADVSMGSDNIISTAILVSEQQQCVSDAETSVGYVSSTSDVEKNSWGLLCSDTYSNSNLQSNMFVKVINSQFACVKCDVLFTNEINCKSHLATVHNIKTDFLHLESAKNRDSIAQPSIETLPEGFTSNANSSNKMQKKTNDQLKRKMVQGDEVQKKVNTKKSDEILKKVEKSKKPCSSSESVPPQPEKQKSSHKIAWQKKMNRELGSYICEFKGCNVRFSVLDNLEYHKKCHVSGGNKFACPECAMKFENWGAIAGHLWRSHSNDMELHACDQCPFRTYSLSRLENIHKAIHQDECLFLCDTCGKKFKNLKQLRNHRVIHSDKQIKYPKKIFDCKICSVRFLSKKILHLHQNAVHDKASTENHFVCKYCDYTCLKSNSIRMHERQHTGEKPYSCDQCDYRTADHNSLRRHKMKHSGLKPYKCPYCTYAAIQASCYKDHLKKKHPGLNGDLLFSCAQCSFRTVKHNTYIAHMAEHECLNIRAKNTTHCVTDRMLSEDAEMFSLVEAMDISLSHALDCREFLLQVGP